MRIVVWRGIIVDYVFITQFIDGFEVFGMANAEEIKRYWNRPDDSKGDKKDGDV